jgi:hypothetical protein
MTRAAPTTGARGSLLSGREVEELRQALAAAAGGQGGLVLVAGEAGVGKPRLVLSRRSLPSPCPRSSRSPTSRPTKAQTSSRSERSPGGRILPATSPRRPCRRSLRRSSSSARGLLAAAEHSHRLYRARVSPAISIRRGRTERSESASTTRAGSRSFPSGGLRHGCPRERRRSQRSSPSARRCRRRRRPRRSHSFSASAGGGRCVSFGRAGRASRRLATGLQRPLDECFDPNCPGLHGSIPWPRNEPATRLCGAC